MRLRFVTIATVVAGLGTVSSAAQAQLAIPMQGPSVEKAGTLVLIPSIGLMSDDSANSIALYGRARYSLVDRLSLTGRVGVIVGDLDEFGFGADVKFQILKDGADVPVDLAVFGVFDFGVGDVTLITGMGGVLVGKTVPAGDLRIGPYGGLGVGFGHFGRGGFSNTDPGIDFIIGCNFGITKAIAAFTELDIGLKAFTLISWQVGLAISLGGGSDVPATPKPDVDTEVTG